MNTPSLKLNTAITLLSALSALPQFAFAQSAGDGGLAIEEIIVTAQKREQNIQDVPIAIQAFSDEMLNKSGVTGMFQLSTITPSLNITTHQNAATPFIRGIGTPDGSIASEQSIAMYVDGVYSSNSQLSFFDFNNIERIEVVKGPQGTLFGRNATGGLINITTRDPTRKTTGKASISYGDYDSLRGKFYGATGFGERVAGDIAIVHEDRGEGWGYNYTVGEEINKMKQTSVRSKWLVTVGENTELRLTADYGEIDTGIGPFDASLPGTINADGQIFFAQCVAGLGGSPAAPTSAQIATCVPVAKSSATPAPEDWFDSYAALVSRATGTTKGVSAKVNHSFGNLELISITAYRDSDSTNNFEQAASRLRMVEIDIQNQGAETLSQELQLLGDGETLDWIIGAYYYEDKAGFIGPGALWVSGVAVAAPQNIYSLTETNSVAAFGEINWAFRDDSRITVGARWTEDERDVYQTVRVGGQLVANVVRGDEWSEPTWRLVLDHDLNEDTLLYGSYSRGFKSGNYNVAGPGQPSYNPEFLDAYEIGMKTSLLDSALQLNMAAFFYDYDDLQVTRAEAGRLITVNAASAEITGFEMDFVTNITAGLQVRGGFVYLDDEYTEFPGAPGYVPNALGIGGNSLIAFDASGNKLVRVPDTSMNLGASYTLPAAIANGALEFSVNYYYNDGFYWTALNRSKQEAYELVHASLTWRDTTESWGVRVFGDNLLDEEYASYALEQALGDQYEAAAPRTYGLEVFADF